MKTSLFLDANAGLPARPEVLEVWQKIEQECPANPASPHAPGRKARAVLERARETVAGLLQAEKGEIVFTSGATEANNLALLGGAALLARETGVKPKIFGSEAEHPSVLGPLRRLQQDGFPLTLLPVGKGGFVEIDTLSSPPGESVIALQWANNETGCVQNLEALRALSPQSLLHCDGAQGWGKLNPQLALENADFLVLSGHKFGAPKGVGVLLAKDHLGVDPIFAGGGHQGGLRPGTESPALAAAFALALELSEKERPLWEDSGERALKALLGAVSEGFPEAIFHQPAPGVDSLPNTVSVGFPGIDGRVLLPACEKSGLAVSAGSACSTGAPIPSTVLIASGIDPELARATLRISFPPGAGEAAGETAGRLLADVATRAYEVAKR